MSHPEIETILDDCIGRVRAGETPQSCLAQNPAAAAELGTLLDLSATLHALPPVKASPEAFAAGKESMLAAATAVFPATTPFATLKQRLTGPLKKESTMQLIFRAAALTLFLFIFGSGLAVAAAGDSLPGDALYPLKRSWESTRLELTWDPVSRQALESRLQEQRRQEIEALLAHGRTAVVEFEGLLQSMAGQEWLVAGLSVQVDDETIITGVPAAGRPLRVRARISGGGELLALAILAEETTAPSPINDEVLPPTPTATAVPPTATHPATPTCEPVHCNQHTPTPHVTATPHVTHTPQPTATCEPVYCNQHTPTPHVTATPHATHTPQPTATCEPAHCNYPTPTPHVTATPPATHTPQPTATCEPVHCNYPTPTPHATATPHVTHTPQPTATCEPVHCNHPTATVTPHVTHTPLPTATCEPVHCNYPTPTPQVTATPYVTHTPQPTATCEPVHCNQHTPTPHPTATATPHHTHTPQPTATCEPAHCNHPTPTATPHP